MSERSRKDPLHSGFSVVSYEELVALCLRVPPTTRRLCLRRPDSEVIRRGPAGSGGGE